MWIVWILVWSLLAGGLTLGSLWSLAKLLYYNAYDFSEWGIVAITLACFAVVGVLAGTIHGVSMLRDFCVSVLVLLLIQFILSLMDSIGEDEE